MFPGLISDCSVFTEFSSGQKRCPGCRMSSWSCLRRMCHCICQAYLGLGARCQLGKAGSSAHAGTVDVWGKEEEVGVLAQGRDAEAGRELLVHILLLKVDKQVL